MTMKWYVALAAVIVAAALAGAARADSRSTYSLLQENDSLYFNTDKHYTQGLRFSYLAPTMASEDGWQEPFAFLAAHTPVFAGDATDRRYALLLGQSIFTPENLTERPPDPHDRTIGPMPGGSMAG
jgi:lipid A 3-O-deacylase